MVRVHIDGEYGDGGTAGEDVGRCPIGTGMTGTGARDGNDEDGGVAGNGRRTFHCFNKFYVYLQVVWRDVSTFYERST